MAVASPLMPAPTTAMHGRGCGPRSRREFAHPVGERRHDRGIVVDARGAVEGETRDAARSAASMSRSYSTSRWSATNPHADTITPATPSSPSASITSRMSGPTHGSGVRPADCQASCQSSPSVSPTRAATACAVARN
jgi:hypothetical protein